MLSLNWTLEGTSSRKRIQPRNCPSLLLNLLYMVLALQLFVGFICLLQYSQGCQYHVRQFALRGDLGLGDMGNGTVQMAVLRIFL